MPQSLGRQMRLYRAYHDLNQFQMGRKIGASQDVVSRIERGRLQPTEKQAKKLEPLLKTLAVSV